MAALVGRQAELGRVDAVIEDVARRRGRIFIVEGEAGVGKSSICAAACARARMRGFAVLVGHTDPLGGRMPLRPVLDLLASDRRLTTCRRAVLDLLEDAGAATALGLDPVVELRAAELVLGAIESTCHEAPLLMAVEDLHWADAASLALLSRLAGEAGLMRLLLLVTLRPAPRPRGIEALTRRIERAGGESLRLGRLDDAASRELAARMAGAAVLGPRLRRHVDGAAGNPLFISELVGALRGTPALATIAGVAELEEAQPPPSIDVAILHRLSHLAPEVLELLRIASVAGSTFSIDELATLTERSVPSLVAPLQEALEAGALEQRADRFAFRHELIREALYQDLPLGARRALHRLLAQTLQREVDVPVERVAEHTRLGATPGDEDAAQVLAAAGRANIDRAPGLAIELFEQAIELAGETGDLLRQRLAPDLALALVRAGDPGGADACRDAAAHSTSPAQSGRLRLAMMESLVEQARMPELVDQAAAALQAGVLSPSQALIARAWLAAGLVFAGRIDEATAEATRVFEAGPDSGSELAHGLGAGVLAQIEALRGRFNQSWACLAPVIELAESTRSWELLRSQPHSVAFIPLCQLDRLDEARDLAARGRLLSERVGLLGPIGVFHFIAAYVEWLAGRWDDAIAELEVNGRLARERTWSWRVAPLSTHALVLLHRDEIAEAAACVAEAERDLASGGGPFGIELLLLAAALLDEARGDSDEARARLAGAWDLFAQLGVRSALTVVGPDLARMAAAAGDRDRAAAVAAELEAVAVANPGAPTLSAIALRAHGLAADDPDVLLMAVERQREGPRPLELGAACETAAVGLLAHHRGGEAIALLDEAEASYASVRATRDLGRLAAVRRAAGMRRGARGRRSRPDTGWESLTETELRVVRLVTERLTNPEIAERLFISRRTVQSHVSSALRKLGVATRRDLAEAAARTAGWRLRLEDPVEDLDELEPAGEPPL